MNQDYDPTEYMRKLRRHKVYRNGRIQLWASLRNMMPGLDWVIWPMVGFVVGFIVYKLVT